MTAAPMQPEDFDKIPDDQLIAMLGKAIRSADEWDKNNPDPQR